MRGLYGLTLAAVLLVAAASGLMAAPDQAIAPFIGEYVGRTIQAPNEPLSPRDLSIKIEAKGDDGFTLEWTTVIHDANGARRQAYSIEFSPSSRKGTFSSAMRRDMFGHSEPLDPLKGDPYVWAHIAGPVLTVRALLINDDGGYEIQVYRRTLTASGLSLAFTRNRDGTPLKTIYGALDRIAR